MTVLTIIRRLTHHPIQGDEFLRDVGIDELAKATIANDLEVELGHPPVSDAEVEGWETVADIVRAVGQ